MDNYIEARKQRIFEDLATLEKEAKVLLDRIQTFASDLEAVHTVEQANEFDRTHDLEEGFTIIRCG
ncbi:MAG: hypothetical protein IJW78_04905 [Clostridia bacterium]|nr:hypothetical protein [Clostridia bacterium]